MWCSFLASEELFQRVEPLLPERAVDVEPLGGSPQRLGVETDVMDAPVDAAPHEASLLQHLEVLGGRVERHPVWSSDLTDRRVGDGEASEDVAAGGVGERGEGGVEIFNHTVE
jgi:hypothetical protein